MAISTEGRMGSEGTRLDPPFGGGKSRLLVTLRIKNMWRALFIACGISLIMVGLECIVVGRFTITKEARLPRIVEELFRENDRSSDRNVASVNDGSQFAGNVAPPQSIQGYGGVPNSVSQFGPSRFGGSQFGNDQFFANQNYGKGQTANSQFSLAGFGTNPESLQLQSKPSNKPSNILQTQDWMPWSLIALGTIVVLYSNSLGRREYGHNGD